MKARRLPFVVAVAVLALAPLFGPAASMQQAAKQAIEVEDVIAWKTLASPVVSSDGHWFGYRLSPQEGDGEVVIKDARSGKETRFAAGEQPQPGDGAGGGRGGAAGASASL